MLSNICRGTCNIPPRSEVMVCRDVNISKKDYFPEGVCLVEPVGTFSKTPERGFCCKSIGWQKQTGAFKNNNYVTRC